MFDRTKATNFSGNVKEYEWTNPHVWIHVMVPDAQGTPREWSFEMQSVQQDYAAGWRANSVKPGDKVSVEFHPLKDGSRGGQLMSATLANGQHLGRRPIRPPSPPKGAPPPKPPDATAHRNNNRHGKAHDDPTLPLRDRCEIIKIVMPAKADPECQKKHWIPAFAGMTR